MNNVNIIGNITKDVDLRMTPNGIAVTQFTLGVRSKQKNDDGTYKSNFINCVAWRQSAEYLQKYASKGDSIGISGELTTRSYKDKDGKTVYVTEVVCNEVNILTRHDKALEPEETEQETTKFGKEIKLNDIEITDDDLPFY